MAPSLPPGRRVRLPGRGSTFVRELPGPPGAPTLMLLHGWTATADLNWFTAYAPLGRHFRVIAMDLRGHGRGLRSLRRFRLEDCADDVAALCRTLETGPVIPVGYSMGGPVAQLVWRRHPELVAGLVLCATSRNFRGQPRERLMFQVLLPGLALGASLVPPPLRRRLVAAVLPKRMEEQSLEQWVLDEIRRADMAKVLQAGQAIGSFSSHDWIDQVDVPAAVVITTRDSVVRSSRQQKLAEAIPGATQHLVPGDHGVCVMQPQLFVPALLDACKSVQRRIAPRLVRSG